MTAEQETFPVLLSRQEKEAYPDCPRTIPYALVAAHERQAQRNHGGQTVQRLKDRGGLGPQELWYVLQDRMWDWNFPSMDVLVPWLIALVAS